MYPEEGSIAETSVKILIITASVLQFLNLPFFSEINVIIRPSCYIFTVKRYDSFSFSFLFPCFFFFVKDQTASFQLKQIIVFLN